MFQKNGDFSKSDLERMLRSPEAQALLARLQQLDQTALQSAVDKAFRGDTAGAKEALSPLLADRQVQQLSEQMRDGHGGV
jgi:ribonuclease I